MAKPPQPVDPPWSTYELDLEGALYADDLPYFLAASQRTCRSLDTWIMHLPDGRALRIHVHESTYAAAQACGADHPLRINLGTRPTRRGRD